MPEQPCQQYESKIRALQQQLMNLSKQWSSKPAPEGEEKSELAHEIAAVNAQISAAQKQFDDCMKAHPSQSDQKPDPCQSFLDHISGLRQQVAQLSRELNSKPAPTFQERSQIVHDIGATNAQIAREEQKYADCRVAHGGKPDLTMKVTDGKVHLDINHDGEHHKVDKDVTFSVTFNHWHHKTWELGEFKKSFDFNGINVDISVDSSFGTFEPSSGESTLHVELLFHPHAAAGDGHAAFDLTSGSDGAMSKTGAHTVTLKGNSKIHENGPVKPVDNNPVSMTLKFTVPTYP